MKIALCFSGQIRTGVETSPNILRYIGDLLPNCDFFVHTWDIETHATGSAKLLGLDHLASDTFVPWPVSRDKVAEFYKIYKPVSMTVEEYNLKQTINTWSGRRVDPRTGKRIVSMFESIYEANLLKKNYEAKNNFTYDYVVRTRPDIIFSKLKTLRDDIAQVPDNKVFVYGAHYANWGNSRLEDILWIGKSDTMDKLADYHDVRIDAEPNEPGYHDWQHHMADWIKNTLGLDFKALNDNTMKIIYQYNIDKGIDIMDPPWHPEQAGIPV